MGLGSNLRKKPIPDPGSGGQKGTSPGSGSGKLFVSELLASFKGVRPVWKCLLDHDYYGTGV
jgi:hypothetical protein